MRAAAWVVSGAALAVGIALGCNGLLGYDPAVLDTTLGGDAGPDGPGGAEGGLTCQEYCNVVMANCTAQHGEYLTMDVCMSICAQMDLVGPNPGDTIPCRFTHAQAAATGDPTVECPQAGPLGFPGCQPQQCHDFCILDLALCLDAGAPYATVNDCLTQCGTYPYSLDAGDTANTSGNTLNCRIYHLESAYLGGGNVTTHCPHTGQMSATCN